MKIFKFVFLFFVAVCLSVVNLYALDLQLMTDSTYSSELTTTLVVGDTMYIQLDGMTAWHPGAGNDTVNIVVSNTVTGESILVVLSETSENLFRGTAVVAVSTSDTADEIGASVGQNITVRFDPGINFDGKGSEWTNTVFVKMEDISDANYDTGHNYADITNVFITSDSYNVYLLYEMKGVVDCGSNYKPDWEVSFDTDPSGGDAQWWVWVDNAPADSGYTSNSMDADYIVKSFADQTTTAGGLFFGDGSTINYYNGSAWVVTGTNKPAGGFPGDHNKVNGNYLEVMIPLSYIGNPAGWCSAAFRMLLTDPSWSSITYDLVPDDSATPHAPVWFKPVLKTSVNITAVAESTFVNTNSNLERVMAYPTIIKDNKKIIFDMLPDTAKIKIYTLTGELVKELTNSVVNGKIEWDFSDMDLAHGVYIAYITDDEGNQKVEKFIYQK